MDNITSLIRQNTKWRYFDRLGNCLSVGDIVYCIKPVYGSYLGECVLLNICRGICTILSTATRVSYTCKPAILVKVDND